MANLANEGTEMSRRRIEKAVQLLVLGSEANREAGAGRLCFHKQRAGKVFGFQFGEGTGVFHIPGKVTLVWKVSCRLSFTL